MCVCACICVCVCVCMCVHVHVLCMTLFRVLILTVGHDSITYCACARACAVYDTVSHSNTYSGS